MLIFYTGVVWLYRLIRRIQRKRLLLVLSYHGVRKQPSYIDMFCPPELFAEQMKYLSKHYACDTIDGALRVITSGSAPKQDTVVVTCDDGYEDNYTEVWPTARRLGIPLGIYVTTECIQDNRPTFILALMNAIDATDKDSVSLPELGLGELALRTPQEREAAVRRIDGYARSLGKQGQDELLDIVDERLQVDSRGRTGGMLTWEQIREMARAGVVIGAHTRTHPVLTQLTVPQMREEMAGSKAEIERAIGMRVRHFAYPYGSHHDIDERVVEVVREAGFESAVDLEDTPPSDWSRYRIGRRMLTVDRTSHPWGGFSPAMFACEIEGIASLIFMRSTSSGANGAGAVLQ